jgi:hypothetical protein
MVRRLRSSVSRQAKVQARAPLCTRPRLGYAELEEDAWFFHSFHNHEFHSGYGISALVGSSVNLCLR